ncbi:MAG: hypothetical protein A3G87_07615 [Omnitrophica bacterium RIFCSPLOWO2_12_FULL_50_11]|nr:MAG: hypothetical protein A3G87_07615 [Omnitrophica bacterium RIFCSPLOWO2_12_FULL_50_11]
MLIGFVTQKLSLKLSLGLLITDLLQLGVTPSFKQSRKHSGSLTLSTSRSKMSHRGPFRRVRWLILKEAVGRLKDLVQGSPTLSCIAVSE